MLLFTEWSAIKILTGEKTQTRRFWKSRRAVPGSEHWAQMKRTDVETRFARLAILDVYQWDGETISDAQVDAEGFGKRRDQFEWCYRDLNGNFTDPDRSHWVVEFTPLTGGYGGAYVNIDQFRIQFLNVEQCSECKRNYLMLEFLHQDFPRCFECDFGLHIYQQDHNVYAGDILKQ